MKKTLLSVAWLLVLAVTGAAFTPVDESVLKIFNESFKEAREVNWTETNEHYQVNFVKDAIRYHVIYDKKGNFISSRRYYFEDKLPMYILFKVKRKFPGKSIYGVTETITDDVLEYHITLEDKKNWWMVKVTSQQFLEITDKMLKN